MNWGKGQGQPPGTEGLPAPASTFVPGGSSCTALRSVWEGPVPWEGDFGAARRQGALGAKLVPLCPH